MLFVNDFKRTEGPIKPSESTFAFLQRSNRPGSIQRCQWINDWFEELPVNAKPTLESRLKVNEPGVFESALFEMQLHSLLRRLNFSVEIEGEFPGTRQKIDFLASSVDLENQSVYVEATVCGFQKGKLSGNSNENDVVEKIGQNILSPHSDIWLEVEGTLLKTLGTKRIVEPFRKLLESHTPSEVWQICSRWGRYQSWFFPSTEIREGDWVLKGTLKPPLNRSSRGQIWGPSRSGAVDGSTLLLKALRKKAGEWKRLDFRGTPFLIAVNACHSDFSWSEGDTSDIRRALFKDPDVVKQSEHFHASLSCVSGVMIFNHAVLGNEMGAKVQLFQNGDANIPERLHFLFAEQKLGDLLSIGSS